MGEVEGAKPPQNPTTTGLAPKNHKFDTEGCTRFGPGFEKLMLIIIGAFQDIISIAGVLLRVLFLKKKNGCSRPKFGEGKGEEGRGGQAPNPADAHDARVRRARARAPYASIMSISGGVRPGHPTHPPEHHAHQRGFGELEIHSNPSPTKLNFVGLGLENIEWVLGVLDLWGRGGGARVWWGCGGGESPYGIPWPVVYHKTSTTMVYHKNLYHRGTGL